MRKFRGGGGECFQNDLKIVKIITQFYEIVSKTVSKISKLKLEVQNSCILTASYNNILKLLNKVKIFQMPKQKKLPNGKHFAQSGHTALG